MSDQNIDQIAAGIKLLLMDVDGVMTDGKLYHVPAPSGGLLEMKGFDTQDGMALQWLSWKGIETGVISGRVSAGTEERCRQCGCKYIYQGHVEKIPILEEIFARSGFGGAQTAYVGDDLTDVVIMRRVGLAIAGERAAGGESGGELGDRGRGRPGRDPRGLRVATQNAGTLGRPAAKVWGPWLKKLRRTAKSEYWFRRNPVPACCTC